MPLIKETTFQKLKEVKNTEYIFNKGSKCLMVFQGNWPGIAKRDCY